MYSLDGLSGVFLATSVQENKTNTLSYNAKQKVTSVSDTEGVWGGGNPIPLGEITFLCDRFSRDLSCGSFPNLDPSDMTPI